MEAWSPYASNYNNPLRFSDPLGNIPGEGNGDKDQKGLIRPATVDYSIRNPIAGAIQTGTYNFLSLLGVDALDDFIADRVAGQNSPKQLLSATVELGISTMSVDGLPLGKGAVPRTKVGGKFTEPKLPGKTIVDDGGIKIEHYTKSGEHPPAHAHVKGGGAATKIGMNGKPLKKQPELTPKQQKVIDNNIKEIRKAIDQINRWMKFDKIK